MDWLARIAGLACGPLPGPQRRRGGHNGVGDPPDRKPRRAPPARAGAGQYRLNRYPGLEVIAANPDRIRVVGLSAGGANLDTLLRQRAETGVTNIAIADDRARRRPGIFEGECSVPRTRSGHPAGRGDRGRRRPQCAGRGVGLAADTGRAALGGPAGAWPTRNRWSQGVRLCLRRQSQVRSCRSTPSTPR